MKKTLLMFIAGLLLLCSLKLHAHSAAIATYKIQQNNQQVWQLTISMPLSGLHIALLKHYEESDLWIDEGQYNADIAIEYLMNTSHITANGEQPILLKSTRYTLDNHQSNFVFEMQNMPKNITTMSFDIPAMGENIGHINVVRMRTKLGNKKAILQAYNNYQSQIEM